MTSVGFETFLDECSKQAHSDERFPPLADEFFRFNLTPKEYLKRMLDVREAARELAKITTRPNNADGVRLNLHRRLHKMRADFCNKYPGEDYRNVLMDRFGETEVMYLGNDDLLYFADLIETLTYDADIIPFRSIVRPNGGAA